MAAAPLLSSAWSLPGSDRYGEDGERPKEGLLLRAAAAVARWWGAASAAVEELWAFARADPRKPVFAAKVALALALISLLVFIREPRDIVSHSIWAILTVVVVFEFSIGARPSNTLRVLSLWVKCCQILYGSVAVEFVVVGFWASGSNLLRALIPNWYLGPKISSFSVFVL
jgi:hypothetical protein